MDLRSEVCMIMQQSKNALTVDQVTKMVAERLKDDIRAILNDLDGKQLTSVHGGGGYSTHYKSKPLKRRA